MIEFIKEIKMDRESSEIRIRIGGLSSMGAFFKSRKTTGRGAGIAGRTAIATITRQLI